MSGRLVSDRTTTPACVLHADAAETVLFLINHVVDIFFLRLLLIKVHAKIVLFDWFAEMPVARAAGNQ